MPTDRVTGFSDSLDKVRLLQRRLPDHEKRGTCVVSLKNLDYARGVFGMRTVIKGERNDRLFRHDLSQATQNLPDGILYRLGYHTDHHANLSLLRTISIRPDSN